MSIKIKIKILMTVGEMRVSNSSGQYNGTGQITPNLFIDRQVPFVNSLFEESH